MTQRLKQLPGGVTKVLDYRIGGCQPGQSALSWSIDVDGNASFAGTTSLNFLQAGVGAVVRTAQSKLREQVSVKDYGAVGDGVTDDTAAFNTATAALNALGGGTLLVPFTAAGYLVDYIKYYSNMSFMPGGKGVIIKKRAGATSTAIFDSFNDGASAYTNVQWLPGFIVDGNYANQSNASPCGFRLQGSTNVLIDGAEIKNCPLDGVFLYGSGASRIIPCDNVVIRSCKITGNRRNNISIVTAQNVWITRCVIASAGGSGSAECNIDIEPDAAGDTLKNINILDCDITGAVSHGIYIPPVGADRTDANITIRGGSIHDNGGCGIQVANNAYKIGPLNIDTNTSGNSLGGIDLSRTYKSRVSGGYYKDAAAAVNAANNNEFLTIAGAVVCEGGTWDLVVGDASNLDTVIGADVQFVNDRFQDVGTRTVWAPRHSRFTIKKVANGTNGCANANGCWVTNGGATWIQAITTANPQLVPFFRMAENAMIYKGSIWVVNPVTGVATCSVTVGNLTSATMFLAAAYDVMTAAANTNFADYLPVAGRATLAADYARFNITFTGGDGTNVAVNSSFVISLFWGTEQ